MCASILRSGGYAGRWGAMPKHDSRGRTPARLGIALRQASDHDAHARRQTSRFLAREELGSFFRMSLSSLRTRFSRRSRSFSRARAACRSITTSVGRYWVIYLCRVDLPTPMSAATRSRCQRRSKIRPAWRSKIRPLAAWRRDMERAPIGALSISSPFLWLREGGLRPCWDR